ncbi:epoxyqueuosine reductase QueH [Sporolactobacillus sp. CPB3-1]|uniref:Epoxyqueuosine reductase QueH n=1 Tax=Sporolactobacillus mangiferae TaxID=2940498 RepID=A0ABT0M7E6_9BACL|nr:epoxyqueuosine reductase QueH [Sporolactobacillus mangiferae]MCL1630553.1 epoxyqueuosine reductase QueH [Sporolactobacillus mangiferae]
MINADEIVSKLSPNQKINYDSVLLKMIESWKKEGERPNLLIHSCCAPCSTYVLEFLSQYADIVIYYTNSNIHPKAEYERRKYVQEKFILDFNERTGHHVRFLAAPYRPLEYFAKVKGLEKEPEGGARCSVCFEMRLDLAAKKAKELGCDYFTTVLTISPHKNSQVVNKIGLMIQKTDNCPYLPADFKKRGGYQRSVEMCKEYAIYRQCYCGCIFAALQQGVDLVHVVREAKSALKDTENVNKTQKKCNKEKTLL